MVGAMKGSVLKASVALCQSTAVTESYDLHLSQNTAGGAHKRRLTGMMTFQRCHAALQMAGVPQHMPSQSADATCRGQGQLGRARCQQQAAEVATPSIRNLCRLNSSDSKFCFAADLSVRKQNVPYQAWHGRHRPRAGELAVSSTAASH